MATRPTKVWEDDPSTATPLSAAGLIDAEDRFFGYTEDVVAEYGVVRLRGDAVGNNSTDDAVALQAVFDANRSANLWMEGENRTYRTAQPLILGPSQKLRHCKISAHASYAPVATPMLTNAQGGVLSFTADVGTDVITTPSAHGLPADDILVMFKGAALPGGLAANTYYYVRDRTSNTFKVSATAGGAAVDITSAGSGGTVYLEVGSLQKVYIDDVYLDGGDVAATGARFSLQQQSALRKFRIDNFTSVGLHLSGQQAIFENFEAISNPVAMSLDNALFMYFYGFNAEACNTAVYVRDATGPYGGGAYSCGFWGVHLEQNDTAGAVGFDLGGPHDQLTFDNVSVSMNVNGQKVLYQHSGDAKTSGYTLRNVRINAGGSANRPTMIDDDDRGFALDSWDDFRFRLQEFHAPARPTSDAFTDPGPITIALPGNEFVRMGATVPGLPAIDTPSLRVAGQDFTGGGIAVEQYVTGQYYPAVITPHGGLGGVGAQTLNRAFYTPFVVYTDTTFDRIACFITANGSAGSLVRLGVYNADGTDGLPGTVRFDAGTVATDAGAAAIKEITISEAIPAGRYWGASVAQVAAPTVRRTIPIFGFMSSDFNGAAIVLDGVSGAFGASPAVSAVAANPTLVALRAT